MKEKGTKIRKFINLKIPNASEYCWMCFIWKRWTIFIYTIWVTYIVNSEKGKKNIKCVTKRWNISNSMAPIPFEYWPKWFIWIGEQFLYIKY